MPRFLRAVTRAPGFRDHLAGLKPGSEIKATVPRAGKIIDLSEAVP